jgi:ribonuclease P protein component
MSENALNKSKPLKLQTFNNSIKKIISNLRQFGKRFFTPIGTIVFFKNENSKLIVSISRKIAKANKRNKIKRWIREAIRQNNKIQGFQIMFIIKQKWFDKYSYEFINLIINNLIKSSYFDLCSS